MKNKLLIMAVAALAVAACAKQQDVPVEETQPMAVGFDAYLNRAVTKATTLDGLQGTTSIPGGSGFGIFAYYTDNDNYDGTSIPNFMYNEDVTWNSTLSKWEYSPVKYWPNEYGADAQAEESDRISFFAYAPYALDNGSGKAGTMSGSFVANSKNIIGFTKNNYAGDPLVKYVVDLDPSSSVDLVWGRQPASNPFAAYDGTTYTQEGLPWLNVRRPQYQATPANTGIETVKFQFDHALAALNVTVDHYADAASFDNNDPANNKNVEKNTRIWIRSITFTGFATEGALNLNNTETQTIKISATNTKIGKALWESINGEDLITGEEVTIYDGRKDGKEGTTTASNEKYTGLNTALIQSAVYENPYVEANGLKIDNTVTGVTSTSVNLFNSSTPGAPIYVIPTGDEVKVTIAYDVETYDANLATYLSDNVTHGSSISNVISKTVTIGSTPMKLTNGNQYTIKLHLGMNSVKVDAEVTPWGDVTEGSADLPKN